MSSIVLSRTLGCALLAICCEGVLAKNTQPILSCDTAAVERTVLLQAPRGTHRLEKHVLEVITKKGPQRFVDKPPYDEGEMGGLRWRYCGFNAHAQAHLIERTDESSYSGELLLNESGKLLHAGHTVLFAPSGDGFLAIEQEDGVDGEDWAFYDANGKAKWKGYAGTIAKVNGIDTVISTYDHPQWSAQGQLTARYVCSSSKVQGIVTLAQSESGNWSWRGHRKCS